MTGQILLDFDGTVAVEDTTDRLLEHFADLAWREVEALWQAGAIGSRECLSRQVDLIRASERDLDRVVGEMAVDPGLDAFIAACSAARFTVKIVSDGFDRVVHGVLARAGVRLPVTANRLDHLGDGRWRLAFPHAASGCVSGSGNCKCAQADTGAAGPRVVVGDGRSDFCVAGTADYVFAKGALQGHCQRNGIAYVAIGDLTEATARFGDWHARLTAAPLLKHEATEPRHG